VVPAGLELGVWGGEAGVIAVTRAADFFLDGRHLKVPTDAMVGRIVL
jgi:hypothetical protein